MQTTLIAVAYLFYVAICDQIPFNVDNTEKRYIVTLRSSPFPTFQIQASKNILNLNGISESNILSYFEFEVDNAMQETEDTDDTEVISSFHGFVVHCSDPNVLQSLENDPNVLFIERDSEVRTQIDMSSEKLQKQYNSTWGLARISSRYNHVEKAINYEYYYSKKAGEGVDVYVIDTGINIKHPDFEGRAKWGKTISSHDLDKDGNGHGSHVAGTVAGKKFGVAKKANVIAVKVLSSDGSGTTSDVILGLEYVVKQHQKLKSTHSVINMSLGGSKSKSLELAVKMATKAGIHVVVAAGNSNDESCNESPSGSKYAIVVAASDIHDKFAYFSNYGKCVTIIAPGVGILSVWNNGTQTKVISGTSMAAPHVAGAVAVILSNHQEAVRPESMKKKLADLSTLNLFHKLPKGTPNRLLYSLT